MIVCKKKYNRIYKNQTGYINNLKNVTTINRKIVSILIDSCAYISYLVRFYMLLKSFYKSY